MELKPCPFCGGEAQAGEFNYEPAVSCTSCLASIDRIDNTNGVEAWNRRAESDLLTACKNELREIDRVLDDPRSHNTMTMPELVRELKRENADLLAALKDILDNDGSDGHYDATLLSIARNEARAAIARHEHE